MLEKFISHLKYKTLIQMHKSDAQKIKKKSANIENYIECNVIPNFRAWKESPFEPSRNYTFRKITSMSNLYKSNHRLIGVILETRIHNNLVATIQNFIEVLNQPVILYCSEDNLDFVMNSQLKPFLAVQLFLIVVEVDCFSARDYNSIFISPAFWKTQPKAEKVLVFQTDGYLNPDSKYSINDFWKFDYIGPNWFSRIRTNGLVIDGGVGGVSLRSQSLSIEAVNKFQKSGWVGGEDDFFGFYIELLGGLVGRKRSCDKFCQQHYFINDTFAIHQPINMSDSDVTSLINKIPGAQVLFAKNN